MITVEQARAGLVAAIELKGADYVYELWGDLCVYLHDGKPSCIVGHAVAHVNNHLFELLAAQESEWMEKYDAGLGINEAHIEIDPIARRALTEAQGVQDCGRTWGEALQRFDDVVIRLRENPNNPNY